MPGPGGRGLVGVLEEQQEGQHGWTRGGQVFFGAGNLDRPGFGVTRVEPIAALASG